MSVKKKKSVRKKSAPRKAAPRIGSVAWLRRSWIDFFKKNNHLHLPSSSLIPTGDPTLLFTTAGMVQFKPYFAGMEKPPARRTVTVQKCLRTTDLEEVGRTARHCTFFEMLGNFSFGDYFKEGAIDLAWDFSLNVLKFDPERIYISVYTDDDEAARIWEERIGVPPERIVRLGKKDNWWGPAGDSGPCGPCTELYLDRGPDYCSCEHPNHCRPGDECERYLEYWNLVFNEFNQDVSGKLHPLAEKGIDTGAGLERIAALLNDKDSVYDTDELTTLIKETEKLTTKMGDRGRVDYGGDTVAPFRVIADHARSACFALADGVRPDNTGRGYVVRRIIRRAQLFARELGLNRPLLHRLVRAVIDLYGPVYPELKTHAADIETKIRQEEERFLNTLEQGLLKWQEYLAEHRSTKNKKFSGERAFRLYDTFGFPLEMTIELAEREGYQVDLEKFEELMQKQREAAQTADRLKEISLPPELGGDIRPTDFTGYERTAQAARIVAILQENRPVQKLKGGEGIMILDRSCFYAESGGQLGDSGRIRGPNGALFRVRDTRKTGAVFLHIGEMQSGELQPGAKVELEIDIGRREDLARHHSATHLLNRALRERLGDHILQTGSLVAPDYLRFDFSHGERILPAELRAIEDAVNQAIARRAPVKTETLPLAKAREKGALATFGEKYGEDVRVVSVGPKGALSLELCGGTHVSNTGDIGYFHILKEGSPGAGNRRIEAIAGDRVPGYYLDEFQKLGGELTDFNERVLQLTATEKDEQTAEQLLIHETVPDAPTLEKHFQRGARDIGSVFAELQRLRDRLTEGEKNLLRYQKQIRTKKSGDLMAEVDPILAAAQEIAGVRIVRAVFSDQEPNGLRKFGDALKEKSRSIVVLLGNRTPKGPILLFMANAGAVAAGVDCGALIREAAPLIGGGGGGRPEMAQAGGKDSDALESALLAAEERVKNSLPS